MLKKILFVTLILTTLFWPFIFGFGLIAGIVSLAATTEPEEQSPYTYHFGDEDSDQQILSIPISGPIYDERPDNLGSFDPFLTTYATFGQSIKEELYEAAEDDSISGIVLEINSPGGTVTGSKAIADGIAYYKQITNKPVYAYGSGVVASGAYWSAVATDSITVEVGSLVGSIGVIGGQFLTYNNVTALDQGLFLGGVETQGGIDFTAITAGEGKDFGNPFREPSEKELGIAQTATNDIYDVFVNYVATQRELTSEFIKSNVGAHVYGESQALNLGLIDQIGNRETVYFQLAQDLDLGESFKIVRTNTQLNFFESIFGVANRIAQPASKVESNKFCIYTRTTMVFFGNVADMCL